MMATGTERETRQDLEQRIIRLAVDLINARWTMDWLEHESAPNNAQARREYSTAENAWSRLYADLEDAVEAVEEHLGTERPLPAAILAEPFVLYSTTGGWQKWERFPTLDAALEAFRKKMAFHAAAYAEDPGYRRSGCFTTRLLAAGDPGTEQWETEKLREFEIRNLKRNGREGKLWNRMELYSYA